MSSSIDIQLGRRLRRRRRLIGLTQTELGALCGLRFQQIQKYESAANKISASMMVRLAKALRVEVSYLYDGISDDDLEPPRSTGARPATQSRAA